MNKSIDKIGIIIPTHNRKSHLKIVLNDLNKQKIENILIDVIVVVDGSTDGTIEMLVNDFPYVHVINGDGSWWYTRSMNEGFKYAIEETKATHILTLNDDIEIGVNYLSSMRNAILKTNNRTIFGSLSITKELPPRITAAGVYRINSFTGKHYHYFEFLEKLSEKNMVGLHKTLTLPGRGMLIPVDILIELNFFDEEFPQYHSDADFCLRAIKNNINVYSNWDAVIYSFHKLTSKSSTYLSCTLKEIIVSFFDLYSRNNIVQIIKFQWRHLNRWGCAIQFFIFFITRFKCLIKK